MKKSRYTEEQIVGILKEGEAGICLTFAEEVGGHEVIATASHEAR